MSKSNDAKNTNVLASLLFLGRDEKDSRLENHERNDASSSSLHAGELARSIRARSTRFLTHASPTVEAVEENVAAAIALARGDALTKTLETHALMDADGRHVGRSLERVNEDAFGVGERKRKEESEALAKTKREIEALVEAKEKEREKEEEKREKETKERRRKELKEAMMFRKEEE